jgi:hypothetical protein
MEDQAAYARDKRQDIANNCAQPRSIQLLRQIHLAHECLVERVTMERLRGALAIDPSICSDRGGRLRVIADATRPDVIQNKVLTS